MTNRRTSGGVSFRVVDAYRVANAYTPYELAPPRPRPPCVVCWIAAASIVSAVIGAGMLAAYVAWRTGL